MKCKDKCMTQYEALDHAIEALNSFARQGLDEAEDALAVILKMQKYLIVRRARRNVRKDAMRKAVNMRVQK